MTKHPPATRWERCSNCHDHFLPCDLVHISEAIRERVRGWICLECKDKLLGWAQVK